MEEIQTTSLFGIGIDPASKTHLSETARWARFLAIVGFVAIGFIVLVGIFASSFLGTMAGSFGGTDISSTTSMSGAIGGFLAVVYIIVAAIYFFPCLFLYRFAVKMKTALAANDQETLNVSFQNLKKMFRFVGILTIIFLALFAIQFLFLLLGAGMAGF